jgi:hypothetical protein
MWPFILLSMLVRGLGDVTAIARGRLMGMCFGRCHVGTCFCKDSFEISRRTNGSLVDGRVKTRSLSRLH